MKTARLWKAMALPIFFFISIYSYSQTPSLSYFEANIGPNADSTATTATFVVAVEQYAAADSLAFKVTSVNGETAYMAGNTVTGWIAAVPYRIEDNTLYLTVGTNAISGTPPYNTEARLRDNTGSVLSYTR